MRIDNCTRRDVFRTIAAAAALPASPLAAQPAREATGSGQASPARERFLLDPGWRFHFGHANDPAKDFGYGSNGELFAKSGEFVEPGKAAFDDHDWAAIDLPHDWAVELPFRHDDVLTSHGSKPLGRGYPETSVGWYRKVLEVPRAAGKRYWLEFDGVFRDSIVVFNGHYLGRNLSGYAPFSFDVTDFMNHGAKNVLVLRVDATENEGWFYEGAGIYRHVWLVATDPLHIPQWGVVVRSDVRGNRAEVHVTAEVRNDCDSSTPFTLTTDFFDPAGKRIHAGHTQGSPIDPWVRREMVTTFELERPELWSIESPNLYRVETAIQVEGREGDRYATPFGIRTVMFDADGGFFLNGKRVEIKGTCNHQDHAGVGSALPDRLHYYRIERLKEMGSNAYRTSHNPPAPEILDACDRLGMLVMDETRMMSSSPEGMSQLERMIRRDRNHPSVVIWSLGNEEREQGTERGVRIVASMKRLARRLDPTRPVTVAMNGAWGRGISPVVDVQGFNYAGAHESKNEAANIDRFHRSFPKQPVVGSETASTVSTRGIYANDPTKGYLSAYDVNYPPWASPAEVWWKIYAERPFLAGGFAWTGFDYRGEPTPYGWPCISSHFGILDICGFPKDNFYYYKAWWGADPVLHLFPHWNWRGKEGQEINVWVHSNLDRVELFLNGRSLGAQEVARNSHIAWKVPYAPGVIEARGIRDGKQALVARRETTGDAAKILLRPDRSRIRGDGEDIAVIAVEIQDRQGRLVPDAGNQVTFRVSGARLIGVGNGDPSCHESDKGDSRSAFNGLCMAIVQARRSAGEIRIEATSPGLEGATAVVVCESAPWRSL